MVSQTQVDNLSPAYEQRTRPYQKIYEFAKREGYLLENSADPIRWLKVTKTQATPPTKQQFTSLINQLRVTQRQCSRLR